MASFNPGCNFNPANRAEILFRLHDGLQPGLKLLASAPNMKLLAKRLRRMGENQTGAENTNRENRRIASLAVWSFGGAQFSTFLGGDSLQDD